MAAYRDTRSLSVYPTPASDSLMALLRAYLDDSKDGRILTIGGYLSDIGSWENFDVAWKAVLDTFDVPYLHMKEFWNVEGLYKHIKADPAEEVRFFSQLLAVLTEHARYCVHGSVLLEDLKRFNRDYGKALDAYALAVYGCVLALQDTFAGQSIEIIFDKFERAGSRIEKGLDYARSDIHKPLDPKLILATKVEQDESWRAIRPLQAGDFMAWEMRRCLSEHTTWLPKIHLGFSPQQAIQSYGEWFNRTVKELGRPPRQRRSFNEMRDLHKPKGFIFNYENLELLLKLHPHGWKVKKSRRLEVFSGDQDA